MRIVQAVYGVIGKFSGMAPHEIEELKTEANSAYGKIGATDAKPQQKKIYQVCENFITRTIIAIAYVVFTRWMISSVQEQDDDEDWEDEH